MPFELQLSGSYGQQEYVVNYNETILTFIMRLAEKTYLLVGAPFTR